MSHSVLMEGEARDPVQCDPVCKCVCTAIVCFFEESSESH